MFSCLCLATFMWFLFKSKIKVYHNIWCFYKSVYRTKDRQNSSYHLVVVIFIYFSQVIHFVIRDVDNDIWNLITPFLLNEACPLGSYCPRGKQNKTTGLCDPWVHILVFTSDASLSQFCMLYTMHQCSYITGLILQIYLPNTRRRYKSHLWRCWCLDWCE